MLIRMFQLCTMDITVLCSLSIQTGSFEEYIFPKCNIAVQQETLGCEFELSLHSQTPSRRLAEQHRQNQEVTAVPFQKRI